MQPHEKSRFPEYGLERMAFLVECFGIPFLFPQNDSGSQFISSSEMAREHGSALCCSKVYVTCEQLGPVPERITVCEALTTLPKAEATGFWEKHLYLLLTSREAVPTDLECETRASGERSLAWDNLTALDPF